MPRKRLVSILLVAAVTLMNALCVCQRVHAAAASPPEHSCCGKHQPDPQPTPPHDSDCHHCNGTASVTAVTNAPDAVLAAPVLLAIIDWPAFAVPLATRHELPVAEHPSPPPATLLQMHCALNL